MLLPERQQEGAAAEARHPTDAEALERFGAWLAQPTELGRPAASLEIVCRRIVSWSGNQRTKVFLIRWTTESGEGFVGITGPVTWSFMGIPMAHLEALKAHTRWRRLINLYAGWWACFQAAQRDSAARERAASLDRAGLEAAFPRDLADTLVSLGRSELTQGHALLGDTYLTSVPGRRCRLACHAEPEVYVEPGGRRHYTVPATLSYEYGGGTVLADYRLFLRGDAQGRLQPFLRQLPLSGQGVVDDLPLYHWVGTWLGPFEFSYRAGGLSLFDP
ncbi:MAG: hypothetical protein H6740_24265 [Alphaproteobacteria bacterium]|nr:hypothetical protein [Alphaproteobacteria bacterium]